MTSNILSRDPWKKGELIGQKAPFKVKDIWAVRRRASTAASVARDEPLSAPDRTLSPPWWTDMTLSQAYPEISRRLLAWSGFAALQEVMRANADLRIYVAGGAVRNVLIGRPIPSRDWDFFLSGDDVSAAIEHFARHGRLQTTPYGAPRWHPPGDAAEYADLIPIAGFVPGLWPCEDIVDVLDQFDFTANAIAFDLRTGQAYDPQNGARDARRGIMKMVRFDYPDGPYVKGAALDRNVVLWFRIVHYASTLGFAIEPLTRKWLVARGDQRVHAAAFEREFFRPDLGAWESIGG